MFSVPAALLNCSMQKGARINSEGKETKRKEANREEEDKTIGWQK